jgi:hypothetical protein
MSRWSSLLAQGDYNEKIYLDIGHRITELLDVCAAVAGLARTITVEGNILSIRRIECENDCDESLIG